MVFYCFTTECSSGSSSRVDKAVPCLSINKRAQSPAEWCNIRHLNLPTSIIFTAPARRPRTQRGLLYLRHYLCSGGAEFPKISLEEGREDALEKMLRVCCSKWPFPFLPLPSSVQSMCADKKRVESSTALFVSPNTFLLVAHSTVDFNGAFHEIKVWRDASFAVLLKCNAFPFSSSSSTSCPLEINLQSVRWYFY